MQCMSKYSLYVVGFNVCMYCTFRRNNGFFSFNFSINIGVFVTCVHKHIYYVCAAMRRFLEFYLENEYVILYTFYFAKQKKIKQNS